MSKFESLYKKVELFEKLAVYGNRSNFLQSIAQQSSSQNAPTSYPGDVEQAEKERKSQLLLTMQQIQGILQGIGKESNAVGNAALFPDKTDWDAVDRDINSALMMGFGLGKDAQKAQLQQLQAKMKQLRPSAPADPGANEPPMVFKDDRITGYAPIDKQKQQAIFQFVLDENLDPNKTILPEGKIDPKFIDGKLGKQTRSALEAVKNYFAKAYPQNKRMSDQEAMTAALAPAPGKNRTA